MHLVRFFNFVVFFLAIFVAPHLYGQEVLKGKVINKATGEPIPFAAVSLIQSKANVTTDFDGRFNLPHNGVKDTLVVQSMGYERYSIILNKNAAKKELVISLKEEGIVLEEAVVHMGEDPAYPIMRKLMKRKRQNDPERIPKVSFHKYSRMQIDLANITESFKAKKMI